MWQELIGTLNELNKTYRALIELSEKKHQALIVIDLKSIEAMNGEEAKLAQRIRALEAKLDSLTKKNALANGKL